MKKKSKYDYLLKEEQNIKEMYLNQRLSSLDIAKKYNINPSAVCFLLNKFGIERRDAKNKSKFILNHNYFNEINSSEKAYWLGFIFADGFVTKNKYIGIALSNKDENHLEKFKKAIESNHIIHTYKCDEKSYSNPDNFYSKIIFKSEIMSNVLKKYGCIEQKSLKLKFPNIEKQYYKDFIRGYFDGDGSFSFSHKNYDFKIVGTREFLIEIINILNKELNLNMTEENLYKRYKNDKNTFYTSIGNKTKTLQFLNYIYEDSNIYLDRKYKKYLDFLKFID